MVLTSCGEMDDGKPTGLWLEEFSVPHRLFVEAGYKVKLVSLTGGAVPVDARSLDAENPPEQVAALALLQDVGKLSEVDPAGFGSVFFPGGHGTMFDMPDSDRIQNLVRAFVESGKPSAFVCHGPAALVGVKGSDGQPLVQGRKMTGFTDDEEEAVELTEAMPFLLETRLKALGAVFVGAANFEPHTVVDGNFITGQNPASSQGAAEALIDQLRQLKSAQ